MEQLYKHMKENDLDYIDLMSQRVLSPIGYGNIVDKDTKADLVQVKGNHMTAWFKVDDPGLLI